MSTIMVSTIPRSYIISTAQCDIYKSNLEDLKNNKLYIGTITLQFMNNVEVLFKISILLMLMKVKHLGGLDQWKYTGFKK